MISMYQRHRANGNWDAFEIGKQHLDFLSEFRGDLAAIGLGDIACHLTGIIEHRIAAPAPISEGYAITGEITAIDLPTTTSKRHFFGVPFTNVATIDPDNH